MKRIHGRWLLYVIIPSLFFTGCHPDSKKNSQQDETSTLKIAYLPITHALPLFAANELPEDKKSFNGLELIRFGSWTELIEALNAGKVDGASVLAELAVKAREQGFPLVSAALGHRDGNVVVVAPDIHSAQDLIGKTIAIPHRLSTHHILLQLILSKNSIDPEQITITELPPPEMPAALSEKRIAAYIVAEPFGAGGVVAGVGKVLYQSQELWENSVCCTLVFNEKAIENKKDAVAAFMQDYLNASDLLAEDRNWQFEVANKYLKFNEQVIRQSLEWINYNNLFISETDYQELVNWMSTFRLTENPPAYNEFVDTLFTSSHYHLHSHSLVHVE